MIKILVSSLLIFFISSAPTFAIQRSYDFGPYGSPKSIDEYCLSNTGIIGQAGDAADDLDSEELDGDLRSAGYNPDDFKYTVASIFKHVYNVYFVIQVNSKKYTNDGRPTKQGILVYEYNCRSDNTVFLQSYFYSPSSNETFLNLFSTPIYDDRYILYADFNSSYGKNKTYFLLDTGTFTLQKGNFQGDILNSNVSKPKSRLIRKKIIKSQKEYIMNNAKFTGFQQLEADIQFIGDSNTRKVSIDLLQGGTIMQK